MAPAGAATRATRSPACPRSRPSTRADFPLRTRTGASAGSRSTRASGGASPGCGDAAARIRELVAHRTAVVHVVVDELAPIVIDTRYRAYGWRYALAGLPPSPRRVVVQVAASAPLAPTVFGMRNGAVADLLNVLDELARSASA